MKTIPGSFGQALLLIALCSVASMCIATAAETTSPETRARMIQLINQLESDPFLKDGKDVRGEVLTWLVEAPDISVTICGYVLGDITKFKGDEAGTLVVQLGFSEAKFILENPDKAADQHAINVAGVEGVLRTYASMKKSKPKLAIRQIDELVKLHTAGQLDARIDAGLEECRKAEDKQ